MRMFMYRFKEAHGNVTRADLRKLGYTIGILSGIVLSAAMMAYYQWNPEVIRTAMDTAIGAMSQNLDRNSLAVLETMENNFPQLIFFSNLFYCTLWAFALSAILASKLIGNNPFESDEEE